MIRGLVAVGLATAALGLSAADAAPPASRFQVTLTAVVDDSVPAVTLRREDGCTVTVTPGGGRRMTLKGRRLVSSVRDTTVSVSANVVRVATRYEDVVECPGREPERGSAMCKCIGARPTRLTLRYLVRNGIVRFSESQHDLFQEDVMVGGFVYQVPLVQVSGLHQARGSLRKTSEGYVARGSYKATERITGHDVQAVLHRSLIWELRFSRSRG